MLLRQIICYINFILASFIQTCFLSEPDFPKCNTESVQKIFSHLKYGVPEIGLLPVDPLKVSEIRLLQGTGPVSINATLTNVQIDGFSRAIIKSNKWVPGIRVFKSKIISTIVVGREVRSVCTPWSLLHDSIYFRVYPQRGYSFVTKLRLPQMKIEGNYILQGRILLLPLVGKGTCVFEPSKCCGLLQSLLR